MVAHVVFVKPKTRMDRRRVIDRFRVLNLPLAVGGAYCKSVVDKGDRSICGTVGRVEGLSPGRVFAGREKFTPNSPEEYEKREFNPERNFRRVRGRCEVLNFISRTLRGPGRIRVRRGGPVSISRFGGVVGRYLSGGR